MNLLNSSRLGCTVVMLAGVLMLGACGQNNDDAADTTSPATVASASPSTASPSASAQPTKTPAPSPSTTEPVAEENETETPSPAEAPATVAPTPGKVETVAPENEQPEQAPQETQQVTTPPAETNAPAQITASSTPACDYGQIHIYAESSENSGAAGSRYINLSFTNSGNIPCSLSGYPGVNYVDGSGNQIGAAATHAAEWTSSGKVIAPGESVTATLRETKARLYDQQTCQPETASGYRVTIPGSSHSLVLAFPAEACSNSAVSQLSVGQVGAQS